MRTVKLNKEFLSQFEGVLSYDPDRVDIGEATEVHQSLSKAGFLASAYYGEGKDHPVLEISGEEKQVVQTLVGTEAITGFLQDQGRL